MTGVPAYLDHAASTPMRPVALAAMTDAAAHLPANPSGAHRLAREARRAIDDARQVVADALGADLGEVVFTSGGTEADNLAVLGVHDRRGGVLVTSAVEHHAVLDPVLGRGGRVVRVQAGGTVDLDHLAATVDPDVTLVSVMLANNEVGTVQDLDAVAGVVRARAPGAALHTDAVQAAPWLDVASRAAGADLIAISAHKFGGPKGVGALVVRGAGSDLAARSSGGGQERERRHGTQNVAGIVALAAALEEAARERATAAERVGRLTDRLRAGLLAAVPDALDTAAAAPERLPGICHLVVPGVETEALLVLLEQAEVYASAAASCASGATEPSHVLAAMGLGRAERAGALRLSLGWSSTDAEVDHALEVIPAAVAQLRRRAGRTLGGAA